MNIIVRKPTEQEIVEMKKHPTTECEVSEFDWYYENEETCLFLQGEVTVSRGDESVTFGAGDLVIFPKGLSCVWNVKKPMKKHFCEN